MRTLIAIFVLGAAVLCLAIAGCGGGGDSSSQIDKASFVEQAQLICEQASGKMAAGIAAIGRREAAKPGYNAEKTEIDVMTTVFIPGVEEELQNIRALGIPTEAKKDAQAFVGALQKAIEGVKANPKATAEGTAKPYEAVEITGTQLGISGCPIKAPEAS